MASAFFRGPRASARWFARYKTAGGAWRSKRVRVTTRTAALAIARKLEETEEMRRHGLAPPEGADRLMGEVLERFGMSLTNRSWRDDAARLRLHVVPRWGALRVVDVTVQRVVTWLDEMRAEARLAPGTQRHLLSLLGRAFSWAVARGLAPANPVTQVPRSARPQGSVDRSAAWIADDETPRRVMELLPEPHRWIFFLAFGTGARLGEVLGLRLEDLDGLAEGCVRIAGQYDGRPLKEDKKGLGRVKFVPAPLDAAAVLAPWLEARREAGSRPGDLVFPGPGGRALARHQVAHQWKKVARALGISVSWHKATRTSAASRWAARGLTAEEIGTALGHHGSEVAQRHYMLYQRRVFDARMTLPVVSAVAGSAPAAPSPVPGQTEPSRNPLGMPDADQHQGTAHGS